MNAFVALDVTGQSNRGSVRCANDGVKAVLLDGFHQVFEDVFGERTQRFRHPAMTVEPIEDDLGVDQDFVSPYRSKSNHLVVFREVLRALPVLKLQLREIAIRLAAVRTNMKNIVRVVPAEIRRGFRP